MAFLGFKNPALDAAELFDDTKVDSRMPLLIMQLVYFLDTIEDAIRAECTGPGQPGELPLCVVVTSLFRPQGDRANPGVHNIRPVRGADVRACFWPFHIRIAAVQWINKHFKQNRRSNGKFYKTALYEVPPDHPDAGKAGVTINEKATAAHIHLQLPPFATHWRAVFANFYEGKS